MLASSPGGLAPPLSRNPGSAPGGNGGPCMMKFKLNKLKMSYNERAGSGVRESPLWIECLGVQHGVGCLSMVRDRVGDRVGGGRSSEGSRDQHP